MEKFKALGLSERTLEAIQKKGFEEPTDIQALTIPVMLNSSKDIIAQAQTGTGKTATFALPLLETLDPEAKHVQSIILAPTRELVIQICEEINSLRGRNRVSVAPIYGGQSIELQLKKLKRGVSIVVGTPGRILDHLRRKSLKLDDVRDFILDEADEMLNMGFIEDIEEILSQTPEQRRVLLFSATMPKRIKDLANKYLRDTEHLKTKAKLTTNLTDQIYFEVFHQDKFEALCRIIDIEQEFYAIIFCRTKNETDDIASHLIDRGYAANAIHGDISQHQREKILRQFRNKQLSVLVATDVAARGIDVNDLTHVINYSLPQNTETYVHRIGRTGRAGREGTAITFVTPSEFRKLGFIKKVAKADIRKENIPSVKTIIEEQKRQISEELIELAESGDIDDFREWSEKLLEDFSAIDLVSALMTHAFGKKLDSSNYREIRPVKQRGPKGGRNERGRGGFDRDGGGRNDRGGRGGFDRDGGGRNDRGPRNERGHRNERGGRERDGRSGRFVEEEGRTRLFIAKGKKDGFGTRDLLNFINEKAGTHREKISNCSVHENYSFVTVPFLEAEYILKAFRGKDGRRSIVEKANR